MALDTETLADPEPPNSGREEGAGRQFGPYRALRLLGKGGMGAVYLAEQQKPIRRVVALKVIKPGMDTREVIARFESERQALALMDHPNIARVFDAGSGSDGRPYFAMEYVPGIPVTEYCDSNRLTNRERLELFLPVCQAVHHAHQKGVIHRDLKPSNVLVSVRDGIAVPKVIDFGVAKAVNQKLVEQSFFTEYGVLIGTPEYMSPEQAGLNGQDVDTTSDIYALGVVLYELLVGVLPFDPKELRKGGYDEMRRIIREEEAPRSTARLHSLGDAAKDIAARHRTTPEGLKRQLRGELDWITLKAMEKDRQRRYSSAAEFAGDVGRYLNNEPIAARPASFSYQLQKFAQRNKVAVGIAAAVLSVLVVGIIVALQVAVNSVIVGASIGSRLASQQISSFLVYRFDRGLQGLEPPPSWSDEELKKLVAADQDIAQMLESTLISEYIREINIASPSGQILSSSRPDRIGSMLNLYQDFSVWKNRPLIRRLWELLSKERDYESTELLGTFSPQKPMLLRVQVVISGALMRQALLLPTTPTPATITQPGAMLQPRIPAPATITQLYSSRQAREFERSYNDCYSRVTRGVEILSTKKLSKDQANQLLSILSFKSKAEQQHKHNLVVAVEFAQRADALTANLLSQLR